MRTRWIAAVALAAAIGFLMLAAPARADDWWTDAPWAPAAPSLTDVSADTQTPGLFTVTGQHFTPGGRIYLAVYDQMGARLYETRWITASLATPVIRHEAGESPIEEHPVALPGGTLREAFGHLCGATAMMRALDEETADWSNWLTVEPACPIDGGGAPFGPGPRPY